MSKLGDLRRFVDGHSMWGALPKRGRCELAKFFGAKRRFERSLIERDGRLNKIVRRYGRPDLQIVRMHNRFDCAA